MNDDDRAKLKAIVREAVAEELDARQLARNREAIRQELEIARALQDDWLR